MVVVAVVLVVGSDPLLTSISATTTGIWRAGSLQNWLNNQNYFGRHFKVRQPDGEDDRGVYKMSPSTVESMDNEFVLTYGSSVDPNGSEFECGPFGLIKGAEVILDKDKELLIADNDFGAYVL